MHSMIEELVMRGERKYLQNLHSEGISKVLIVSIEK